MWAKSWLLVLFCFVSVVCFGQNSAKVLQMNKIKDVKVLNSFYTKPTDLVTINDSLIYFAKYYSSGESICRYNLNSGRLYEYMIPDISYTRLHKLTSTPHGVFALYVNMNTEERFRFDFRLYYVCDDTLIEVKDLLYDENNFKGVQDYKLKHETFVVLSGLYLKDAYLSSNRVICAGHYPNAAVQVTCLSSDSVEFYGGETPPYPDTLKHDERTEVYYDVRLVENPSNNKKFALVYLRSALTLQILQITNECVKELSNCNIIELNKGIYTDEITEYVKFRGRDSLTKKPIVDTLAFKLRREAKIGLGYEDIVIYGVYVAASPEHIYMLNSGKKFISFGHHCAEEMYVADWNGKLVNRYSLPYPTILLHYDNNRGKLYGLAKNPNDRNVALYEISVPLD